MGDDHDTGIERDLREQHVVQKPMMCLGHVVLLGSWLLVDELRREFFEGPHDDVIFAPVIADDVDHETTAPLRHFGAPRIVFVALLVRGDHDLLGELIPIRFGHAEPAERVRRIGEHLWEESPPDAWGRCAVFRDGVFVRSKGGVRRLHIYKLSSPGRFSNLIKKAPQKNSLDQLDGCGPGLVEGRVLFQSDQRDPSK